MKSRRQLEMMIKYTNVAKYFGTFYPEEAEMNSIGGCSVFDWACDDSGRGALAVAGVSEQGGICSKESPRTDSPGEVLTHARLAKELEILRPQLSW